MSRKRYYRDLIVRAIEDFIVLFLMGAAVWSICHIMSGILAAAGVG